jgi:hypothetical protein
MNLNPFVSILERGHASGLLLVFTAYILVLIVYAGVYYLIYRLHPRAYLFNADIMRDQTARFTAKHRDELETLRNRLEAAAELKDALQWDEREPAKSGVWSGSFGKPEIHTQRYRFKFVPAFDPPTTDVSPEPLTLEAWSNKGKRLWTWESKLIGGLGVNVNRAVMLQAAQELLEQTDRDIEHKENLLKDTRLIEDSSWSFWDFVYFSGVTLSTVGYGDILPNSTAVRMLVLSEILIGLALLIVVLNVFLGSYGSAPTNPSTLSFCA